MKRYKPPVVEEARDVILANPTHLRLPPNATFDPDVEYGVFGPGEIEVHPQEFAESMRQTLDPDYKRDKLYFAARKRRKR